ncbi:N-acetyl-alpha-D-glucosaminyl L-malate synthase BshA [bacterium]|nr:N-acetyl-alpha-D-glucosaminyl L-malate synthase BshA [FCB group bacterium]MBL7190615.1 N-acetyl-alpha-D-glucosaminyl L-malate synthase BshA [bacterium]
MKIGISCYPTYGGSGIIAAELGKILAERGNEVHFISYAPPTRYEPFQERVYYHEVEVPDYPLFEYSPYSLALASVMADIAVYHKLDLIHAHYAIPHAASAYLAKQITKGGFKTITTLHGTDITLVGNEPSFLPITRFSIEMSDGVTAVSRYLAQRTISELKVDKPIQVIYNFVDTEFFRRRDEAPCRSKFADKDEFILMHISNFRPVKRMEDLIEIVDRIRKDFKVKLLLIGDGPMRSRLQQICREKNLEDNVVFLGKQTCIVDLLSIADLYLQTSQTESFGLSALEAMSCSVPVISSRAGGTPEVVQDGITGYLEDVGDIEAMADKVKHLLGNNTLRAAMGKKARDRVENHFSADKIVDQYEAFYAKALEQRL